MTSKDKISALVVSAVREYGEEAGNAALSEVSPETILYGQGGVLDSLALVSVIVDLEAKISDQLGVNVVLADEKAMSQMRSPFRSIGSLADYVELLVNQKKA